MKYNLKADLEYVSKAKTLKKMKTRLEECKKELRLKKRRAEIEKKVCVKKELWEGSKSYSLEIQWYKEILGET